MKIVFQRVEPKAVDRFVEQVRRLSPIEYQRRHDIAVQKMSNSK